MKGPVFGAMVGAVIVWGAQNFPVDTATGQRVGTDRLELVGQAYMILHEGRVEVWLDMTEHDALEYAEAHPEAHVERITVRRRVQGSSADPRSQ